MTPAGLAFFQSDYDTNVKEFYHNVLNMKEPMFEYDFPKPYNPPERYWPLKQAFNLYLDRYRDPKQVRQIANLTAEKCTHLIFTLQINFYKFIRSIKSFLSVN